MKNKGFCRWWRKNEIWKFIVNVFMPFLIPLAITIAIELYNNTNEKNDKLFVIFIWSAVALSVISLFFQLISWIKEKHEANMRFKNQASKRAFDNMFSIFSSRKRLLVESYHHGLKQGMLCDADIPYNIFTQIKTICLEFRNTIVDITGIKKSDMDIAFIYRYCYDGANDNDRNWRWVIGKGAKFSVPLSNFTVLPGSTFHYIIQNDKSTFFYNDKADAIKNGQYIVSYRDQNHEKLGSICAAKIAFSGNDQKCCEGIIMINTYGHQFLDNLAELTVDEFRDLIFDEIFACYRNLLETELGMLYFRHETEPDPKKCNSGTTTSKSCCVPLRKKTKIRCRREITKVVWERCNPLKKP